MRLFFEELLIGFELKNFLIALAVLFIVYLAWESTYVRDYRVQPNAVLIIENNRRLLVDIGASSQRDLRPGTDWTFEPVATPNPSSSSGSTETASREANTSTSSGNNNNLVEGEVSGVSNIQRIPTPPPSLEVVIEEVHDLASVRQQLNENVYRTLESFEEGISELLEDNAGPQEVIAAMDTSEGLRRRPIGFVHEVVGAAAAATSSSPASTEDTGRGSGGGDATDSRLGAENCSSDDKTKSAGDANATSTSQPTERNDEFRIKIKYLNDDMKLVTGSPNENIGDFKKRNFTLELSAQKFVRLVFNGHVLQPDSKTLQACGLFDNCVVHCLVHNRNPSAANQNQQQTGRSSLGQGNTSNQNPSTTGNNSNPSNNDVPLVENFSNHEGGSSNRNLMMMYGGILVVTLSLIFSWYCRIQYHVLFSWYSTLVLILVTIIFSILVPLLFFIENNEVQQQTTTT